MINLAQEVLTAPHSSVRIRRTSAYAPNRFFINALLFVVSIPAAAITVAILLAMIPFRIPEMFSKH